MTPGRHAAADGSFRRSAGAAAARGIVLLGVAVVLGIVLLTATDTEPPGVGVSAGDREETGATDRPRTPTTTIPATTTTSAPVRAARDVKVLVVNDSGVRGAAARVTDQLRPAGYNLLAPTNAPRPEVRETSVYFTPGFDREAAGLAGALQLPPASVKPVPTPPPLRDMRGANVLVVVGSDLAGRVAGTTTTARATTTARPRTTTTRSTPTTSTTAP